MTASNRPPGTVAPGHTFDLDAELEHLAELHRLRSAVPRTQGRIPMFHNPPPRARAPEKLLPNGLFVDAHELLHAIARELDGVHWNADTLHRIARALTDAGYDLRVPGEDRHGSE